MLSLPSTSMTSFSYPFPKKVTPPSECCQQITQDEAIRHGKSGLQEFLNCELEELAFFGATSTIWKNRFMGWSPTPVYSNQSVRLHDGQAIEGWELRFMVSGRDYNIHIAKRLDDDLKPVYRICSDFIVIQAAWSLEPVLNISLEEAKKLITSTDALILDGRPCFQIEAFCKESNLKFIFLYRPDGERYNLATFQVPQAVERRLDAIKLATRSVPKPKTYNPFFEAKFRALGEVFYRSDDFDIDTEFDKTSEVPDEEDPPTPRMWRLFRDYVLGQVPKDKDDWERLLGPMSRAWVAQVEEIDGNDATEKVYSYFINQYGLCVEQRPHLFQWIKTRAALDLGVTDAAELRITDWYDFILPRWERLEGASVDRCVPARAAIATVTGKDGSAQYLVNLENETFEPFSR